MKTYNLEPKYNVCLDEIMKLKDNNNLSWEKIEEIGLKENAVFEALFPEDYKEKWSEMVEYLKHIKNDAKVKDALKEAVVYYEKVRALDPNREKVSNWPYQLRMLYNALGETDKANEISKMLGE